MVLRKTLATLISASVRILKTVFQMPGGSCRFHPSCSVYAREAFENHSFLHAALMTIGRVLRCHPFSRGGFDPVPCPPQRRERPAQ